MIDVKACVRCIHDGTKVNVNQVESITTDTNLIIIT